MKRALSAFVIATLFVSATALAGVRDHRSAHVTFWIPDAWSVDGDDATQLTASDPKGEVALLFVLEDAHDMKAAMAAIDATIARLATDVKMGSAQKVDINGMEGSVVDATGKADGKKVELSVLIVKTPGDKYLMIFGVLESKHKKAHEAEVQKILASLKPAR